MSLTIVIRDEDIEVDLQKRKDKGDMVCSVNLGGESTVLTIADDFKLSDLVYHPTIKVGCCTVHIYSNFSEFTDFVKCLPIFSSIGLRLIPSHPIDHEVPGWFAAYTIPRHCHEHQRQFF